MEISSEAGARPLTKSTAIIDIDTDSISCRFISSIELRVSMKLDKVSSYQTAYITPRQGKTR